MLPHLHRDHGFEYIRAGSGPNMLLLHGLFGALSNWEAVLAQFGKDYTVYIPVLPIYDGNANVPPSVEGLADYVARFTTQLGIDQAIVIGNSLGGHVALMYTLAHPERVQHLILTGSSGLFEAGMGQSMPRRGDYAYIQERVAYTFYDPATATKELVDEVMATVNNRVAALRIISFARNAQRLNMQKELQRIHTPTLLIWGLNDNITPAYVAHEFHRLIKGSVLRFIDRCGHAAMMERPAEFNGIVADYLQGLTKAAAVVQPSLQR